MFNNCDSTFTHSCPSCRVARRAAMKDRNVCRFRVSFWMVPQVCCMASGAVPRGLPHVVEHSEGVSDLVETVLDVTPCSSIIPYRAAQVSELLRCRQVFSVNMNWFRAGNVQQHHFCILLADLQANLLCVGLSFPARLPEYERPSQDHLQNLGPPSLGRGSI